MTLGSLFSGIGGLDLGLERAGLEIKWQVERDPYCRKVLAKHWPDVPCYEDVTTLTGEELEPVDVICGGFPCQPVSVAGTQKGTDDERWLWPEFNRLLRILRPRYAILENVPGLFTVQHGKIFGAILRDLHEGRYDAEWDVISAAAVGAPHLRKRVFIIATNRDMVDPERDGLAPFSQPRSLEAPARIESAGSHDALDLTGAGELSSTGRDVAYTERNGRYPPAHPGRTLPPTSGVESGTSTVEQASPAPVTEAPNHRCAGTMSAADADRAGHKVTTVGNRAVADAKGNQHFRNLRDSEQKNGGKKKRGQSDRWHSQSGNRSSEVADADSAGLDGRGESQRTQQQSPRGDQPDGRCADRRFFDAQIGGEWLAEPHVGRVVNGFSAKMDRVNRLKGLGNAVVPQVAEWIGRRLIQYDAQED